MKPIKEKLIAAVGDISMAEEHVKQRVSQNIHKKRFRVPKYVPILSILFIVAIVTILIIENSEQKYVMPDSARYNEEYFTKLQTVLLQDGQNITDIKKNYLLTLNIIAFAKHKNITLEDEEFQKLMRNKIEELHNSQVYETLKESDFDLTTFENEILPYTVVQDYYLTQLRNLYGAEYPSFSGQVMDALIEKEAPNFYFYHYQKDFLKLSNFSELKTNDYTSSEYIEGFVIDVTDDAIFVVKDGNYFELSGLSPDQIASFNDNVYKIIRTDKNINIHDYVMVEIDNRRLSDEKIKEVYPLNISKSVQSFYIEEEEKINQFIQYVEPLQWTPIDVFVSYGYEFYVNLYNDEYQYFAITYDTDHESFIIYDYTNSTMAKITAAESEGFLQLIKSLN